MERNLDQKLVLADLKSHLLSLQDMEIASHLLASKIEEMVKKAANKIADDKLHSEDVLQQLKCKIISLQLVESDDENFSKLCQILQNSIEHNNIEAF